MLRTALLSLAALLVLGAIVAGIVFGAKSVPVSVTQEHYQTCLDSAEAKHEPPIYCPKTETLWDRGFEDPVAYYTFWLALFTVALAIGAMVQSVLVGRQISLAREEFIASHRPRLRVRLVKVKDPSVGNPIKIEFTVTNAGDSDARDIKAEVTFSVQPDGINAKENFSIASHLAPGEPLEVSRITKEAWQPTWKPGVGNVRVHGQIAYKDSNGIARRTGFYRFSTSDLNRFRLPGDSDIERDYEYED